MIGLDEPSPKAIHEAAHTLYAHQHGFEVSRLDVRQGFMDMTVDPSCRARPYLVHRIATSLAGGAIAGTVSPGDWDLIHAALALTDPRFRTLLLEDAQTQVQRWATKTQTKDAVRLLARLASVLGSLQGPMLAHTLACVVASFSSTRRASRPTPVPPPPAVSAGLPFVRGGFPVLPHAPHFSPLGVGFYA